MIFLMEKKCTKDKIKFIKRKLKFDHCFVVDSLGSSRGLAFLWKHGIEVELNNYTKWDINARVTERNRDLSWRLTGC